MVIAMYLLLFCLTVLLLKSYRRIIVLCFVLYLSGIFLLLVASLLYMAKFSYYHFPLSIDYSLYLWISAIKVRVSVVSRIYNVGLAVIMLVSCILFSALNKRNKIRDIILILPIIAYVWYNDYNISERLYILMYGAETAEKVTYIVNIGRKISIIILFLYMLLPILLFIRRIKESKYHYAKRENLVCLLCLTALDIFVAAFFIFGYLKSINPYYSSLLKYPVEDLMWNSYYLLPLSLTIVLLVIIIVLFLIGPFRGLVIFEKSSILKNSRRIDKSTRLIFHSYKNSFVTIAKLVECTENALEKDTDVARDMLNKIRTLSLSSVENISTMIASLEEINISVKDISIRSCIEQAVKKAVFPENIEVEITYKVEDAVIKGSSEHIVSMMLNLINNAVEAIEECEREDGRIYISVDTDESYMEVSVMDNGKGMKKSEIKNIYKSLFSTKSGCKNFGLGLTYVDKVVKAHFGHIHVKSKPGEGTQFQILFPLKRTNMKRGTVR